MSQTNDLNEQRFQDLLRQNRRRFGAIARTYGQHQADDLLQEILLQIWRGLPNFREESTIDTWCYRVALNTAISWTRSSDRRRKLVAASSDAEQVAGTVDGHNVVELLQRFMETLTGTDRAIVLMYLDDMTSQQMAEVLGLTDGAVRVRIHRIKQKLSNWDAIDQ